MAQNKKPRKAYKPKRKVANLLKYMSCIPEDKVVKDLVQHQLSLEAILRGDGTIDHSDMVTAALNACSILCLQHKWPEYYETAVLGQRAQVAMNTRFREGKKMLYTGPEMQAVKAAFEIYKAQLPLMTPKDMTNAAILVSRELVKRNFTKSL